MTGAEQAAWQDYLQWRVETEVKQLSPVSAFEFAGWLFENERREVQATNAIIALPQGHPLRVLLEQYLGENITATEQSGFLETYQETERRARDMRMPPHMLP